MHVHASAPLAGRGHTSIVLGDLRDRAAILADPALGDLVGFGEPATLLLVAILHFITDADEPARLIGAFRDALPPGSYLALSHGTDDFHAGTVVGHATEVYNRATAPLVLRSHAQITGFFDGFDLAEPGLVQVSLWRQIASRPVPAT